MARQCGTRGAGCIIGAAYWPAIPRLLMKCGPSFCCQLSEVARRFIVLINPIGNSHRCQGNRLLKAKSNNGPPDEAINRLIRMSSIAKRRDCAFVGCLLAGLLAGRFSEDFNMHKPRVRQEFRNMNSPTCVLPVLPNTIKCRIRRSLSVCVCVCGE